jgi:hypothetical protein
MAASVAADYVHYSLGLQQETRLQITVGTLMDINDIALPCGKRLAKRGQVCRAGGRLSPDRSLLPGAWGLL